VRFFEDDVQAGVEDDGRDLGRSRLDPALGVERVGEPQERVPAVATQDDAACDEVVGAAGGAAAPLRGLGGVGGLERLLVRARVKATGVTATGVTAIGVTATGVTATGVTATGVAIGAGATGVGATTS
jgi:hypothetical protein